jgi:hypothetical protein
LAAGLFRSDAAYWWVMGMIMRRGLLHFGGGGGRGLVDGLWFGAAFVLLVGMVLRVVNGFVGNHQFRFFGIAVLLLGVLLAVFAWIGGRIIHDDDRPH